MSLKIAQSTAAFESFCGRNEGHRGAAQQFYCRTAAFGGEQKPLRRRLIVRR